MKINCLTRATRFINLFDLFKITDKVTEIFRDRLASGFFWSVGSAVSLQGSVLITGLILARVLRLHDYGIYALATTTVMTVVGMAQGGVGITGTKFIGEYLYREPRRISLVLTILNKFTAVTGILSTIGILMLAPWLGEDIFKNTSVVTALRWAALANFFYIQSIYLQGALQGLGEFRALSRAGAKVGIAHLILSICGAIGYGLNGAIIAFSISSMVRWWSYRAALKKAYSATTLKEKNKTDLMEWRAVGSFALPAGLASLVTLPCMWGVSALIASQQNGLALVAIFSAANQIRQLVTQLPVILNSVSSSVLSRLKGQGAQREYWRVFKVNIISGVLLAVVLAGIVAVASGWVLNLYGPGFGDGRDLLLMLMMAVIPEVAGVTCYQLVQTSGRMWQSLFLIMAPRDLTYVSLTFVLLPMWGLKGVGVSYLLSYCLYFLATVFVGFRRQE